MANGPTNAPYTSPIDGRVYNVEIASNGKEYRVTFHGVGASPMQPKAANGQVSQPASKAVFKSLDGVAAQLFQWEEMPYRGMSTQQETKLRMDLLNEAKRRLQRVAK